MVKIKTFYYPHLSYTKKSTLYIQEKITSAPYFYVDKLIQAKNFYICTAKSTTFELKWCKNQENFRNLNISPIYQFLNHKMSYTRNAR